MLLTTPFLLCVERFNWNPAVAQCQYHGMGSIVGVKLAQDGADMIFNRLLADIKDAGYLFIGVAVGDIVQYLRFAVR